MNIDIICVGNLKEKYFVDGVAEYLKRLKGYIKINIVEVKESNKGSIEDIKKEEGERILNKVKEDSFLIPLAIDGKMLNSNDLASYLQEISIYKTSHITFVIGGSYGLDYSVINRGDFLLSFSKFTFPHQLMRLILVEQIYRSIKIIKNEKYHK